MTDKPPESRRYETQQLRRRVTRPLRQRRAAILEAAGAAFKEKVTMKQSPERKLEVGKYTSRDEVRPITMAEDRQQTG
jgi:hypothetical protein